MEPRPRLKTKQQQHLSVPDDPALGYINNQSEDSNEYDTIPEIFY